MLVAAVYTHSHGDRASSADALRKAVPALQVDCVEGDALGWPQGQDAILLGRHRLTRLPVPGPGSDSTAYLLHKGEVLAFAFVGDTVMPGGASKRSDCEPSDAKALESSLLALQGVIGDDALLLPGHDHDERLACTLRTQCHADACTEERVALSLDEIGKLAANGESVILVDVRELFEQKLGVVPPLGVPVQRQSAPLSTLVNLFPQWLGLPQAHIAFYCRSGNRSAQAARAMRRLGHTRAWSLGGGVVPWAR